MNNIPNFLKQKDNAILYDGDGEFLFYVNESFFTDTKLPLAQIRGQYVNMAGICDWAIVSPNGKVSEARRFYLPTIFSCKPDHMEKVKNYKLNDKLRAIDYRILHFKNGDEVISNINLPQTVDNAEIIFKMLYVNSGQIPPSVPYDKIQDYAIDSMRINGNEYGISKQVFGIVNSEICRDPKDLSKPFRLTKMQNMTDYQQISMKSIGKYINPYTAFTGEGFDDGIMASILLSNDPKAQDRFTPLEKILTQ